MKAGILWELLGVSRRVGSMHPLQILEHRLTDEMSAGHSSFIVWYPRLRYTVHCGSRFCTKVTWISLTPRFSFTVECHQCSDDRMLVCDQKTFLTHSFGLQINISPESLKEKPLQRIIMIFKVWRKGSSLWCLSNSRLQHSKLRRLLSYRMGTLCGQLSAGWDVIR